MTAIICYCDKDTKKPMGFEISEHAGFAKRGKDIVCAAISVLSVNVQNSIEKFCDDAFIQEIDPKGAYMKFMLKDLPSHDAEVLLESAFLGFDDIAKEYRKYITKKIKEV